MTLNPGAYTAILAGKNDGTGVGLVEVYDLARNQFPSLAISAPADLSAPDENVMIGGVIVGGEQAAARA